MAFSPEMIPGACVALAGGYWVATQLLDLQRGIASERWPSVEGKVLHVGTHWGAPQVSGDAAALIEYAYAVDGERYTSRRYDYAGGSFGERRHAFIARLSRGDRVRVHYDPARPARAVLEPGVGRANYTMLSVALLICGGGLAWLTYLFQSPAT